MAAARDTLRPPGLPAGRVRACLGLVSDTHMPERCAALPPALFEALRGVDLLLHAGDVGELRVRDHLSAVAPVIAVHGNDDTPDAQRELPYAQLVAAAGLRILLTHAHYPDRAEELASRQDDTWGPKLDRRAALGRAAGAAVVVFGHTHVPMAHRHGGVLLVNPGAIASPNESSRQTRQTAALLYVRDDGAPFVVHVDLAAPDRPYAPRINWDAGFRAAHDRFAASILAPELAADWSRLAEQVFPLAPDACHAAYLRAAHHCWAGQQAIVAHAYLLSELRGDGGVPADVLARIEKALLAGT